MGSLIVLFRFRPYLSISVVIDVDRNRIGSAADWTVFDIRRTCAFGQVKRDDDFFAAGIADVAGFFL